MNLNLLKPASARALDWLAGILIVVGWVIVSPSGAFALLSLACICAAFPAAFGSKIPRIVGVALLVASLASAANFYPQFELERESYARRAKERAGKSPPSPGTRQEPGKQSDR